MIGATRGGVVREIFTTGLTVKIMAGDHGVRDNRRVLDTARQYIYENYQTGEAIVANDCNTRDAWFRWKPIAHLCAAYVDFALRSSSAKVPFIDGPKLAEATMTSIGLRPLPKLSVPAQAYRHSALPNWDRRHEPGARGDADRQRDSSRGHTV